ncbi:DegT/DnrJ/EryC1/StrS family aminotransferase [Rhodopseudomonas palustris]|nr:DegT/DnrJ/EryC1/StrS family aminotransferase [Rhodopseudomonas palustris]
MIKFLDLNAQYQTIRAEIDEAIAGVIERSAFIGGQDLRDFETEFAAYQQVNHCIGVGNGTDAIEILIEALGLPERSEVIVPANSFIASSEAVTRAGLKVVFADVNPDTQNLSPADVERRITPATSAIVAVHLQGRPAPMQELLELSSRYGLKLLEDAAQAHGAEINGRRVGGIGAGGTFSFYPGKNLGAYGDGGAITTNDPDLAKRCRMIANHGRISKYDHEFEGRNSRLDGLQAAILRVKLRHLDGWIGHRNLLARRYIERLGGIDGLVLPAAVGNVRHAFHLFVVRSERRDELAAFLSERGIQTGIHYPIALPKLAAYEYLGQAHEQMFANTADRTLLSLPIGEHLTLADVDTVTDAVRAFHEA